MTKQYEFIDDLTSDVMFKAYGVNEKELFENSALAMFSIICETKKIQPVDCFLIEIQAENQEDLLYKWLSTLISYIDIHNMFFKTFKIKQIAGYMLKAEICGEPIDIKKGLVQVKAITYYKFGIQKTADGFSATVSCDI